jgi:hypothetical protein
MPIEIREITIKTDITTGNGNFSNGIKEKELSVLKSQVLEECKKMILTNIKKTSRKR